jgi:hypothetical protein
MANPFEIVIGRLRDIGFFQFLLPFMLSSAVFYGLLRKSQIFGPPEKNIAVNAVVSMMISFMIWAYPVIVGVDITKQLSTFFVEGMIATLVILFGVMVAGIAFPEGLSKTLSEKWKGGGLLIFLIIGLLIGGTIFVSSGLTTIFFPTGLGPQIPSDVVLSILVLLILVGTVLGIVALTGMGEKKA